ncbi:MAG: CopG family transcriptional regulator [Pyrobaculum sp.]
MPNNLRWYKIVSVSLDDYARERLDEIAKAWGVTRTEAVRRMIIYTYYFIEALDKLTKCRQNIESENEKVVGV